MASARVPAVRHFLTRPLTVPRFAHRRWAQVHDVRFLATHGTQERVLAKYKEKLERKAKEEGKKDIGELKQAYKDKIDDLRKKASVPGATAPLTPEQQSAISSASSQPNPPPFTPPPPPTQPSASGSKTPPGVKTLDSFIDVQKTADLPEKEIEVLWRLRHASNSQSLCAALTTDVWENIHHNARRHPQFILPLPRETNGEQGAEIHFMQWTFPTENTTTVLFTHLAEYKLRAEYSSPHTTVSFHADMAGSKGLVLVQGNVMPHRGVSVDEGKWLLMCLQKFYGLQAEEAGGSRKKLLEMFTRGDSAFRVNEVLDEAEKI
ncbi:ATP11 protein-domain-containing protein [Phyllosticta citribraziliensis]|uniref:ATP11 protein-domain-containing protein n=1 Tax=Phyllosticta citribraziliensis TaxID=989973 RepID=A0ABR1M490_9PEZI